MKNLVWNLKPFVAIKKTQNLFRFFALVIDHNLPLLVSKPPGKSISTVFLKFKFKSVVTQSKKYQIVLVVKISVMVLKKNPVWLVHIVLSLASKESSSTEIVIAQFLLLPYRSTIFITLICVILMFIQCFCDNIFSCMVRFFVMQMKNIVKIFTDNIIGAEIWEKITWTLCHVNGNGKKSLC